MQMTKYTRVIKPISLRKIAIVDGDYDFTEDEMRRYFDQEAEKQVIPGDMHINIILYKYFYNTA